MVTREQIATIGAAFKSPVSNEYGCTEVGIIAMECPQKSMHLMIENLLIEFIRNGRHVEPEEEGEIIITELYGSAMPLIRYQVGDIGSYTPTECDCGRGMPLLHNLKGRSDEFIVCPNGKRVDPIVFEYILKEIPSRLGDVTRFRITQRRKDMLEVEICYSGNRYEELAQTATERLRKVLGDDFEFEFRSVDSITAEPSGKLRCFISRLEG
jgi:phenylacetate-CoA ligase